MDATAAMLGEVGGEDVEEVQMSGAQLRWLQRCLKRTLPLLTMHSSMVASLRHEVSTAKQTTRNLATKQASLERSLASLSHRNTYRTEHRLFERGTNTTSTERPMRCASATSQRQHTDITKNRPKTAGAKQIIENIVPPVVAEMPDAMVEVVNDKETPRVRSIWERVGEMAEAFRAGKASLAETLPPMLVTSVGGCEVVMDINFDDVSEAHVAEGFAEIPYLDGIVQRLREGGRFCGSGRRIVVSAVGAEGVVATLLASCMPDRITADASTQAGGCRPVSAVLSPLRPTQLTPYFVTKDTPGAWVDIRFHHALVMPTAYRLTSVHPIFSGYHLRSWKLLGALADSPWEVLSEHTQDVSLDGKVQSCRWEVESRRAGVGLPFFDKFRIAMTGVNSLGTHALQLSHFEVYGKVLHVDGIPEGAARAPAPPQHIGMPLPSCGVEVPKETPPPVVPASAPGTPCGSEGGGGGGGGGVGGGGSVVEGKEPVQWLRVPAPLQEMPPKPLQKEKKSGKGKKKR